jgi:hypothetical protein
MPPKLIYLIHQPFFTAATEHNLPSIGASVPDSFTVDSNFDFSVNSVVVNAYDLDGSLFDLGVRSDLFEMEIKSSTTGNSFQNRGFDIRSFKELVGSGGFPGMYLPRGSVWTVNVMHKPTATNNPPAIPVTVKVQFFGSLRTAQENPEYTRWMQQNNR